MTWHPYLPEPRPGFGLEPGDPEPVPLEALRVARDLCRDFRTPPRQFRRRTSKGTAGAYYPASDIVAVGMGGDDGYYATLLHDLLHATGHPSRLSRTTTGDYSPLGQAREEGTVWFAQRIVLQEIGFDDEAINWHTGSPDLPLDRRTAKEAAAWILG
jgi:hypothetical protein